jgi:hypothetical protein
MIAMSEGYTFIGLDFSSIDIDWESEPASAANLHLWFTPKWFARMDECMKLVPTIRTREDFCVVAICRAIRNLEAHTESTKMGLDDAAPE